mgnify:CR=1 FL=1
MNERLIKHLTTKARVVLWWLDSKFSLGSYKGFLQYRYGLLVP